MYNCIGYFNDLNDYDFSIFFAAHLEWGKILGIDDVELQKPKGVLGSQTTFSDFSWMIFVMFRSVVVGSCIWALHLCTRM